MAATASVPEIRRVTMGGDAIPKIETRSGDGLGSGGLMERGQSAIDGETL